MQAQNSVTLGQTKLDTLTFLKKFDVAVCELFGPTVWDWWRRTSSHAPFLPSICQSLRVRQLRGVQQRRHR